MEKKKYVTLEDMRDLFAKEKDKIKCYFSPLPEGFVRCSEPTIYGSTLGRHLYAERLLQKGYQEVNWSKECPHPAMILDYAKTWMHPLVWQDAFKFKDLVIDGRVATEEYDDERLYEISEIVNYIYEQDILAYSDEPVHFEEDLPEIGFPKGMHDWSPLTWDVKSNLDEILAGNAHDENEADGKYYDFVRLRYNLNIIAEYRGGKRAAELLRMLQCEWPKIKRWKTHFDSMEEKDIMEFEDLLFNGFDDLLEEWDAETPQEATSNTKPAVFEFITEQCRKEGKVESVETELRAACKGTAVGMWKTIRTNEALGYLSTKDVAASKIYKALCDYFGELPYNERNFRDARNKR